MPKPEEVAQLVVAGDTFEDWKTVWVQDRWMAGYPLFNFTAAERAPLPTSWKDMQFKPGDKCQIMLAGQLAITGIITQRQVAYDATNHEVQLSGVGRTWAAATSSIDSKDGNFDQMSFTPIAQKVLAPFGVAAKVIGKIDQRPFDRLQSQPGELVFDFLDRIARVRGVTIGADHLGNMLLVGQHSNKVVQQLTEGDNILKFQCLFSNEALSTVYQTTGQKAVADDTNPRDSNEMQAQAPGSLSSVRKFLETVAEQPVKDRSELEALNNYRAVQAEATQIIAYATVQGWLRDGKTLWRPGDDVWVYSPMAMMNMVMKIQQATYSQDSRSGTLTVLELVLPWKLGDKPYGVQDSPADPKPPAASNSTTDTPPVAPPPAPPVSPPNLPGQIPQEESPSIPQGVP